MIKLFKTKKKKSSSRPTKKSSFGNWLVGLLNGNILTKEETVQHLPYLLFLTLLALIYITNGYYAEATVRGLNKADNELKELRSEYITTKSDLMYKSKQSEVAKMLEARGIGLKETLEPPKKIVVSKDKFKD